ncbi:MAG: ABC transporter ATP-binding protein [Bacteroidales bacterium]|nr:ABC transporter ATP-binding protein [Bacteroidales bacterium]
MNVVTVDHLCKDYGKIHALCDVSFEVKQGEVFGLVGPDGAGKSTFFNILTTLGLPTSGNANVLGMDLLADALQIRQIIGYLPGTFSLYPDLTVEENLIFFATMYKSKIKDNMPLIRPIWKQLAPFKNRRAGKLSGGMKQKLALCCALIHKPKLLFLFVLTTGVDPVSRTEFWDILNDIKKQDITVIVSTPYMDEATRCDRIALIQNGKIIKIDTPAQIVSEFKGNLFTMKVNNIFELLNDMKEFPLDCIYYPYGEYFHIAFYDDPTLALPQFEEFTRLRGQQNEKIEAIHPTIEDCFIELVTR